MVTESAPQKPEVTVDPQLAPELDPEFKPVSIQHLAASQIPCGCCYYNSSTPGCGTVEDVS